MVNATPRLLYPLERTPVPVLQEVRWAPMASSGRERRRGNLVPTPGFEPRTVKAVERIEYCGSDLNIAVPHTKRNEYQEYFLGGKGGRCVGLTILPPSYADCVEIWEPQLPGTLRVCSGL